VRALDVSKLNLEPVLSLRAFEEIADQVRSRISEGKLRPGDRLPPERELAALFKVSRNTLREALRALELAGLVELKKGSSGGAFVLHGTSDAVVNGMRDLYFLGGISPADLTEARIAIGSAVVRLACARISPEEIAELEANLAAAERARLEGNFEARTAYHQKFHVLLAQATRNPILIATMEGIMEITRHFVRSIGPVKVTKSAAPSRRRLIKYLKNRDADSAVNEMIDYLTRLHRSYMIRGDG
jgi:GntR family transcriptional regulator, transcriptional repressor for pyruvate dehydrogenase complex